MMRKSVRFPKLARGVARVGLVATLFLAILALVPAQVPTAAAQDESYELIHLRTASSKTFRNPDGSTTVRIYGSPIHYFDGDGWEDISLELKDIPSGHPLYAQGYRKYCETNSLVIAGKSDISSEDFLLISPRAEDGSYGGCWLKITLRGVGYYDAATKENRMLQAPKSAVGSTNAGQILFTGVFSGADFRYTLHGGKLKEEIVFSDPDILPDPTAFGMSPSSTWLVWEYEIKYGGVTPDSTDMKAQRINFSGAGGVKFFFPVGFAADNGGHQADIAFRLKHEGGRHFLYAGARYDWLTDPSLVYPVVFDPTTEISPGADTYVSLTAPTTKYGTLSYVIIRDNGTGTPSKICRGFLKFDLLDFPIWGRASGARLYAYLSGAVKSVGDWDNVGIFEVEDDAWSEENTCWDNQPSYDAMISENEADDTKIGQWISWDVYSWVDNQTETDNIMSICLRLKNGDENATDALRYSFSSREAAVADHDPYLEITYSNNLPAAENLKTENQTNPDNLPFNEAPVFSWDYSDNDNDAQSHYEVWVGTSYGGSSMWDSGAVASSAENAAYGGSGLSVGTTYYVQVRVKDNWDWGEWAAGTFKMGTNYAIVLKWEENNEPAVENATLTAYMTNYGTQENSIIDGSLENVIYPELPYWLKLTPDSDNYWRGRIPTAYGGTITFWLTASPTMYDFTLSDLVGGYGPSTGILHVGKWIGANFATITSDYWAPDMTCGAYLILGEKYQIYVEGLDKPQRYVGDMAMTSTTDRIIQISAVEEELDLIYDYVYWAAWRVDNSTIRTEYQDNLNNTSEASVKIYCENGDLANQFQPDNEWFIVTWTEADENESYNVVLEVEHENYGNFAVSFSIGSTVGPPGVDDSGNPFGLPTGLTMAGIGSIVLIIVMALAFDAARVQLGVLAIALTTLFCWYMGFLPLPGPFDGAFTATLIFVMAVLFVLTWRRGK